MVVLRHAPQPRPLVGIDDRHQHASGHVLLVDGNRRAKEKIILPPEKEDYGDIMPVMPGRLVQIELGPSDMQDFKDFVYSSGESSDPDAVFRRSWDWLHMCGFAEAMEKPAPKLKKSDPADNAQEQVRIIRRDTPKYVSKQHDPEKMTPWTPLGRQSISSVAGRFTHALPKPSFHDWQNCYCVFINHP